MLTEAKARAETLNKGLEEEKRLRKDNAAGYVEYVKGENIWISRLVAVAEELTAQLATMGMPSFRFSQEVNLSIHASLTVFFERVLEALQKLRSDRAAYLADESRRLCRGALTKIVTKVAY